MPERITPGVYIEEISSIGRIVGVSTSISVFIGQATENEEADEIPSKVVSYDDFAARFGYHTGGTDLSQALDSFFRNGGKDCYVIDTGRLPDEVGSSTFESELKDRYRNALKNLASITIFNLLVIVRSEHMPDSAYLDVLSEASKYCRENRAFLLIAPLRAWQSFDDLMSDTEGISNLWNAVESSSSALYFPRLCRNDTGTTSVVDPVPAIAGVISRIDSGRGVWKAPAGTEAHIYGASNVDIQITDEENGRLNELGINCIRIIDGKVLCWGARTLGNTAHSEWKYIPVRRLALFIEESIYRGTQWVGFEPNDEPTWARVRASVDQFMLDLFRQGAFKGASPRDAFFVRCDGGTTTSSDRLNGVMHLVVGFAPLRPAEFITVTIQHSMSA